jgi:hypothetical protein
MVAVAYLHCGKIFKSKKKKENALLPPEDRVTPSSGSGSARVQHHGRQRCFLHGAHPRGRFFPSAFTSSTFASSHPAPHLPAILFLPFTPCAAALLSSLPAPPLPRNRSPEARQAPASIPMSMAVTRLLPGTAGVSRLPPVLPGAAGGVWDRRRLMWPRPPALVLPRALALVMVKFAG